MYICVTVCKLFFIVYWYGVLCSLAQLWKF